METFIHMRSKTAGLILMYRCTAQSHDHATLPHIARESFPLPSHGNARTHVVTKLQWVPENPPKLRMGTLTVGEMRHYDLLEANIISYIFGLPWELPHQGI